MLELAICILEVVVLLLTINVLTCVNPARGAYVSDPSIGAAIGNASNRNFENSQSQVIGMSDRGFMVSSVVNNRMWPQPKPISGYMSPPETMAWSNGGTAASQYKK
jgi:hypothetical protein